MGVNQLAEDVKKAQEPKPVPDADIKAALEQERQARLVAEQRAGFFQGAAASEWDRAEKLRRQGQSAAPGTITDPFAKLAAEDPLLPADQRAKLLDEGARSRAREEVQRGIAEERARMQMELEQRRSADAIELFQASHPELASDPENFGAAMFKAKMRLDQKGVQATPMQALQLGYQIYNEGKASPPAGAPFTEAPGMSGAPGAKKEEEPPVSMATELYGADPKDFMDERKVPLDKYTEGYLDNKNLDLVEKEKFWSGLRNVVGDIREAKSRKAAAGR